MAVGPAAFSSDRDGWMLLVGGPTGRGLNAGQTATSSAHWDGQRWTITPTAVPADPTSRGHVLSDIATPSAGDAWAVGFSYLAANLRADGALTEHWDGSAWQVVANPADNTPGAFLNGVTSISPTDIWAVGGQHEASGQTVPFAEHWDGARWAVVPLPSGNDSASLRDVSASGPGDVWAVGEQTQPGTTNTAAPLVEHWNGTSWTVQSSLPALTGTIGTVFAANPDDVWAILQTPTNAANTFLHWDGHTWTTTIGPGPKEFGLSYFYDSLAGSGPTDVWAVGEVKNTPAVINTPLIAHYTCTGNP
jgi:hypothetical protein